MSVWNEFYLEVKDSNGCWKCIDPGYCVDGKFQPQPIFCGNSWTSFIVNNYFDKSIEFSELSKELQTIKIEPQNNVLFKENYLPRIIDTSFKTILHDSKQKYDSSGIVRKLDYDNFIHGFAEYLYEIDSDDLKDMSDLEKKKYQYAEWVDPEGELQQLHDLVQSIYYVKSNYNLFANTDISLDNCRIVCFIY